jgi:hypothetical protein
MTRDSTPDYNVRQAARLLQCSDHHVRTLCRTGQLEAYDIGTSGASYRRLRISEASIRRFKETRKVSPSQEYLAAGLSRLKRLPAANGTATESADFLEALEKWRAPRR